MDFYFDNCATTKTDKEVLDAILPYFVERFGNPSSSYSLGRESKAILETVRNKVASIINASGDEIIFTSGGSESNNLAIKGMAFANQKKGKHIITSKIEHPSVMETLKELEAYGFQVSYINVDQHGIINFKELCDCIQDDTILISIMHANNELGVIEPIKEIGGIAKAHNILFHSDCVQTIGNIKIDVNELGLDALSMSAHKFYGPKGVGALYVRKGREIKKLLSGGHQENNKRAGTENVPGIVGLGKALDVAYFGLEEKNNYIFTLRNYFISNLQNNIGDIIINSHKERTLPGIVSITVPGAEADNILLELDKLGIFISTGSACTAGSIESSHVLKAIGLSDSAAHSTIRVSFGKYNTTDEIDVLIDALKLITAKLRKHSVFYNSI